MHERSSGGLTGRVCLGLLVLTGLFACSLITGSDPGLSINVNDASRDASFIRVTYTVRNDLEVTAYLPACGSSLDGSLEKRTSDGWEAFGGDLCLANRPMVPIPLAAGQLIAGEVNVGSNESGIFRVLILYTANGDSQERRATSSQFIPG